MTFPAEHSGLHAIPGLGTLALLLLVLILAGCDRGVTEPGPSRAETSTTAAALVATDTMGSGLLVVSDSGV